MTTYKTGNPIGSTDARDLYDNAQNLDNFANGTAASYTDRRGVSRRSLSGIDAAADNVLNGIGYAVPVAYASGISLTLTSQTVDYNGVIYAPLSSALPFTTSSWGTDAAKFRAIQVTDADLITYTPAGTGAVATTVQSKLRETVSVKDFGAVGDGVTDDTAAFNSADVAGQPVYVPPGTYYVTTVPTGEYFGLGVVRVLTAKFYLDHAIPTRLADGLSAAVPDPEEETGTRFCNLIAGQNSGAAVTSSTARATTIFGYEALMADTDPVRATGFGKQVFKNMTDVYASDAFGADAIGQGNYVNRCVGIGSNALKWAGSVDPVAVAHDYHVNWPNGDFITSIGLDASNRWPTIRNDFIGSISTPNASRIPTSSSQVIQSVAIGRNALLHSLKTDANVAIGVNAMAHALDNGFNTAVGTRALRDCVSGNNNTAIGNNAAVLNISGSNNVAIGFRALEGGSHTSHNVAIGANAALVLAGSDVAPAISPTARRNVFIGPDSGQQATDGAFNVAIGSFSLANNSASNHTAIGAGALGANTTGTRNTAVGFDALNDNTTGSFNVAVGMFSLDAATTASENTAIGYQALSENVTGTQCVAVGFNALLNSTANQNTAIGHDALRFTQAGGSHVSFANCTGVGFNTRVSGANQVQLGDSSTTTYVYGTVQNRSDIRDKADVRDTVLGLDFITALRPVDYKWDIRDDYLVKEGEILRQLPKDGSKKRKRFHHGLIAQEVKAVCDKFGVDFGGFQHHAISGGEDVMTIGYDEIIAPLIKAVQQLAARVEMLEKEATGG